MLGGQFINGVQSVGKLGKKGYEKTKDAAATAIEKAKRRRQGTGGVGGAQGGGNNRPSYGMSGDHLRYNPPRTDGRGVKVTRIPDAASPTPRKTGTTYEAPAPTPLKDNKRHRKDGAK